jgi:GT2 family glycosyltransferase
MATSLGIIIVNWNSGDQLKDCITSIELAKQEGFTLREVVIVDNASTDDSLENIDPIRVPVRIIRNNNNRGFSAACNQGAAEVSSDYVLFLNPDTCLREHSLSVPLAFMQHPKNSSVGICGIKLFDESGVTARTCARFPSVGAFAFQVLGLNKLRWLRATGVHMIDWDHAITREVDHVIGAFFLIRRVVFNALEGFDERFFVYLEDLDLSMRARRAGWRSVYLVEAQAFHAGGGTSRQIKAMRLFYALRSRLLYGFKHFSAAKAWCLLFITLAVEPWSRLAFALSRCSWIDIENTLKGYRMLIENLASILRTVRKHQLNRNQIAGVPLKEQE